MRSCSAEILASSCVRSGASAASTVACTRDSAAAAAAAAAKLFFFGRPPLWGGAAADPDALAAVNDAESRGVGTLVVGAEGEAGAVPAALALKTSRPG